MNEQDPLIKPGRPRLQVNYALILRLRDDEHLGWTRGAEEYRRRTGQWRSRDTFKRRYLEAKTAIQSPLVTTVKLKAIVKSPFDRVIEEWERKLKEL